ncbi:MAG: YraN family protein [Candidatus Cloacimonetes bacterium]|jgi:putative endonuclease|nr:YraN family protein [Candidatus Cloacimonadota bacterium]MBT6994589.1 YraN family protein [Candidatus Cloacimonadota bacterium]
MKNSENAHLGMVGENLAVSFLKRNGYKILAQNYHSAYGEIDIVAIGTDTLIFIEVKTRKSNLEKALSSISNAKQKKIIKTAYCFLQQHPEFEDFPTRFDAVAIIQKKDNTFKINHLKNAFYPEF